ncbi:hypothetical protein AB9L99_04490 [Escherichia coli]|uniref:hypothetical protein n=1 Tax=Escherichia coli TaxID=562 RepID=UPI0035297181
MKLLAKVFMAVAVAGFAFGANADANPAMAEVMSKLCDAKAVIYDDTHDGHGYLERIYSLACKQKAVLPYIDGESIKKHGAVEAYNEFTDSLSKPIHLKALRDGEDEGKLLHSEIRQDK